MTSPAACPRPRPAAALFLAALAALPGCAFFEAVGFAPDHPDETAVRAAPTREEPAYVDVQHVLVAVQGTGVPGVTRTKEEAERLAQQVLERAQKGQDFRELVRLYSDERRGDGTLRIANFGMTAGPDEYERGRLARGFARAAFALEPGDITLVPWDPPGSPYGWHVLRRIR